MATSRSLAARSLRSRRTHVIGILVAEFEPFSAEILNGAGSGLGDTDYELLAYAGPARVGVPAGSGGTCPGPVAHSSRAQSS